MVDTNNTEGLSLQSNFVNIPDGDSLTCILPPDGGDYWPYRDDPNGKNSTSGGGGGGGSGSTPGSSNDGNGGLSGGAKGGIAVGVILAVVLVALATYFIRKAALKRQLEAGGARRLDSEDIDTWEGKQTTYPPS